MVLAHSVPVGDLNIAVQDFSSFVIEIEQVIVGGERPGYREVGPVGRLLERSDQMRVFFLEPETQPDEVQQLENTGTVGAVVCGGHLFNGRKYRLHVGVGEDGRKVRVTIDLVCPQVVDEIGSLEDFEVGGRARGSRVVGCDHITGPVTPPAGDQGACGSILRHIGGRERRRPLLLERFGISSPAGHGVAAAVNLDFSRARRFGFTLGRFSFRGHTTARYREHGSQETSVPVRHFVCLQVQ